MTTKKDLPSVSPEQEKAIIDTKEVLASKQDVLMAIGQLQAFNNVRKYVTVTELITYRNIKESKQYKGLVYIDENEKSVTVTDLKEICKYFFNRSYEQMQEDLKNLEVLGQDFLESSQTMGLGYRELRKLRQLPDEEQALIINNEAVDLGDKDAVKELIEDFTFTHLTEKAALKKQLEESEQSLSVAREMSNEKQKQIEETKEMEGKRKFSQTPWKHQTLDLVTGMLEARAKIQQGLNQLEDMFKHTIDPESPLDEKALDYCGRTLLSEALNTQKVVNEVTNDICGVYGAHFDTELSADQAYIELQPNAQ